MPSPAAAVAREELSRLYLSLGLVALTYIYRYIELLGSYLASRGELCRPGKLRAHSLPREASRPVCLVYTYTCQPPLQHIHECVYLPSLVCSFVTHQCTGPDVDSLSQIHNHTCAARGKVNIRASENVRSRAYKAKADVHMQHELFYLRICIPSHCIIFGLF